MSLMSSNIFKVNNIDHGNVGTPKENIRLRKIGYLV